MTKIVSNSDYKSGFTLLEVLLSIAIIGIIGGIGIPIYQSFQVTNAIDVATNTLAQSLRRAQVQAQAVDGDISWGVKVQSGSIVVFKGASYLARDSTFDEVFDIPSSVTVGATDEEVYAKFSGLPQTVGTITLSSNNNETRTVVINAKGTLTY